jgi:hypothetical protein
MRRARRSALPELECRGKEAGEEEEDHLLAYGDVASFIAYAGAATMIGSDVTASAPAR